MTAKPSVLFLVAVGMISASALAYEILLMRLFSIIQWHHFATMIISLALNRVRLTQNFMSAIIINMLLFSVAARPDDHHCASNI